MFYIIPHLGPFRINNGKLNVSKLYSTRRFRNSTFLYVKNNDDNILNHYNYSKNDSNNTEISNIDYSILVHELQPPLLPSSKNNKTNKVLVIMIGQPRGGILAWSSLKKYVLDPLSADLAVMFTTSNFDPFLKSLVKYTWIIPEYDDWGLFFYELDCGSEWKKYCKYGIMMGGVNECDTSGSGGIGLAFRIAVHRKLNENDEFIANRYEYFILTRADNVYGCDHPLPMPGTAMIPEGEDYGGIVDRHFMASRELFLRSIDVRSVMCNVEEWNPLFESSGVFNIESTLKVMFTRMSIPIIRFSRNMFTIRIEGDKTRWSQGSDHVDLTPRFHIKVKYPNELKDTEKTCGLSGVDILDGVSSYFEKYNATFVLSP
jgi:hypothetical protein